MSCAAALAVLTTIEDEHLLDQVKRVGEHLAHGARRTGQPAASPACAVRTVAGGRASPATERRRVEAAARDHGLLVNAVGPDALRLAPPLILTEADADEAVPKLRAALLDVTRG